MTMPDALSEESVLSIYAQLLEAWNRRDAEAFAALFTVTGTAIGFDGSQMQGREAIASELRGIFASHPTAAYVAKVREVRGIGPQAAFLRSVAGMVPPGKAELNPAVNAIQSLLVVLESGESEIKVALLQNTPAAFHGRPELSRDLTRELTEVVGSGRTVMAG